jgi:hypothetical protein
MGRAVGAGRHTGGMAGRPAGSRPVKYGAAHKRLRARLLKGYVPGRVKCWRCGKPITDTDTSKVHLGHSDDGRRFMGLEHEACNVAAPNKVKKALAVEQAKREDPAWRARRCDAGADCRYGGDRALHPWPQKGRCW